MNGPLIRFCFFRTLRECCTNPACMPFFLLAVVFYSFYYCWPYSAQLPEHIMVGVVDEDDSPLSRRLTMELRATARLNVTKTFHDRSDAVAAMKSGLIASIITIPPDFEKDALNNIPTALTLTGNGAFIVMARSSIAGITAPLELVASDAAAQRLVQAGAPLSAIELAKMRPPALVTQYMYNTVAGYMNFVAPIVFIIIFQTLMVCGAGMLFNAWFCAAPAPQVLRAACRNPACLAATGLPIACICFFWVLFTEGASFALHGINSMLNFTATVAGGICFSLATGALGLLGGLALKKEKFIIQLVVTSSIPCVFITGNLFPEQNIPIYMRALSWLFPSTPASRAILRASQAGASVGEILPCLIHLLALASLYFLAAWQLAKRAGFASPGK